MNRYGFPEPDASRSEAIAVAGAPRGGNLVDVTLPSGEAGMCRLPTKFRKLILVNRGTFLIVGRAQHDFTTARGAKGQVRFEAVHILHAEQVKHLQKGGQWPVGGAFGDDALRARFWPKGGGAGLFACNVYPGVEALLGYTPPDAGGAGAGAGGAGGAGAAAAAARPPAAPGRNGGGGGGDSDGSDSDGSDREDSMSGVFVNRNRVAPTWSSGDEDDSDLCSESDSDGDGGWAERIEAAKKKMAESGGGGNAGAGGGKGGKGGNDGGGDGGGDGGVPKERGDALRGDDGEFSALAYALGLKGKRRG